MTKNVKGISLISLAIVITIIIMLTNIFIYSIKDNLEIENLRKMQSDIGNLRDKVSNYYSQNGKIPANLIYNNEKAIQEIRDSGVISGATDTGDFLVIDLSAIDNLTLNYGRDFEKIEDDNADQYTDLYIINEISHNIFYVKGITIENETFYTDYTKDETDVEAVEMKFALREGIKVGDYIDYKPYMLGTGQNTYKLDANGVSGYDQEQIIAQEPDLKWQVLRIYEDGSMDLISDPTNATVYFGGAKGYNNGVYLMNDICEKLYSNKNKGITARSVNLEDMEKWLTDTGKKEKNDYISNGVEDTEMNDHIQSVDTKNNTITYKHSYSYYPVLWKVQKNESENYYTEETLIKEDEKDKSYGQEEEELTVKSTYYDIYINETNYGEGSKVLSNSLYYWVASRFSVTHSYYANMGLRSANTHTYGTNMFNSGRITNVDYAKLRAVVTLRFNTKVIPSDKASDPNSPHQINWE